MTVHAVRVVCSPTDRPDATQRPKPEPPTLPEVIPERVKRHVLSVFEEALSERATNQLNGADHDVDVPAHYRITMRFSDVDDVMDLLDAFEQDVVADAEWYRIDHHPNCTHGDERPGDCPDRATEREYGTVPEGV